MLIITPQAANYLKEKQQAIYLEHPPLEGEGYKKRVVRPVVKFGIPQAVDFFNVYEEQGVTVYVPRGLEHIAITLDLGSLFCFKRLVTRVAVGKK